MGNTLPQVSSEPSGLGIPKFLYSRRTKLIKYQPKLRIINQAILSQQPFSPVRIGIIIKSGKVQQYLGQAKYA
jgi:hypothetical protein